jgi:hypothetical protein
MPTKNTKQNPKIVAPVSPGTPELAQVAFEKVKPKLAALAPGEVLQVNLDIPTAASIALGAHERLLELRPLIVKQLPDHPVELLDELPTYAQAAWFAHLIAMPPIDDGNRLKKLLEEAQPLRETLLVAAEALAHRGLVSPDRVAEIRAGQGNIDRAGDLVALSALFRQAWPAVGSKTAILEGEVERAATLGSELLVALGVKGIAEKAGNTPESRDQRARAFTLFANAYGECVRAVAYLRYHEDDADSFAPTLRPVTRANRDSAPPAPEPFASPSPVPQGDTADAE